MAHSDQVDLLLHDPPTWNRLVRDGELVADLRQVDLSGADLQRRSLRDADLTGANLEKANLRGAVCNRTKMKGVNLRGADLTGVALAGVTLVDADMGTAWLRGTQFTRSDLTRATLKGATLISTLFRGCLLHGANFEDTEAGSVVFADVDLSVAHGLDSTRHFSASTVGLDTIIRSQGKISERFLRGCGVPDEVIAYVGSLALSLRPVRLYSCFISHSAKDHTSSASGCMTICKRLVSPCASTMR
jgi:hypothetical protein